MTEEVILPPGAEISGLMDRSGAGPWEEKELT